MPSFALDALKSPHLILPGLENPKPTYVGKVRDCFVGADDHHVIVTTDRLSAFDKRLGLIPFKGQVLSQISEFWFKSTEDICPNHFIESPDPNVMIVKAAQVIPIEVIVRGYLAGTTSTSLLTLYRSGNLDKYGIDLPEGLTANSALERPIITPTTKAPHGKHDSPLTSADVPATGVVDAATWSKITETALRLFERGTQIANRAGILLVDTKYEFGFSSSGELILVDEIHTPDSSRYWDQGTYLECLETSAPPLSFDKDVARKWIRSQCDPYNDPLPPLTSEIIELTSRTYVELFEKIVGRPLLATQDPRQAVERVADVVRSYL